mmetsp:Transcript_85044/g.266052  ORF Transcript_85044/g.266052 Transcript_85044/m.266052 type:complete len:80 (-) Transcript_85044:608-847(-)
MPGVQKAGYTVLSTQQTLKGGSSGSGCGLCGPRVLRIQPLFQLIQRLTGRTSLGARQQRLGLRSHHRRITARRGGRELN